MYGSTLSSTSAPDGVGGQRHAPAALYPQERPGTHCIGGWVGPRASLNGCGLSRPQQYSIPGLSSQQWIATPTDLSRLAQEVYTLRIFQNDLADRL
jgi:hypothetical protein